MALRDITLPTEGIDWQGVLQHWSWLLEDHLEFSVWLLTRFGDLLLRLPDDSIWRLAPGNGTFQKLADSKAHLAGIIERSDRLELWFMPSLVEELEEEGKTLGEKRCYGFRIPSGFEGKIAASNIEVVGIEDYLTAMGDLWGLIRDVPDGTTVRFEVRG